MFAQNKEIFESFKIIHNNYAQDREKWKSEFNRVGEQVLNIIRQYENILCGYSERGSYGKYSTKLSEKFWEEIRKTFPLIDNVGIL